MGVSKDELVKPQPHKGEFPYEAIQTITGIPNIPANLLDKLAKE
jgi:hypothetical protein